MKVSSAGYAASSAPMAPSGSSASWSPVALPADPYVESLRLRNDLVVAMLNCRSLQQVIRRKELLYLSQKYLFDVLAVQELRIRGAVDEDFGDG